MADEDNDEEDVVEGCVDPDVESVGGEVVLEAVDDLAPDGVPDTLVALLDAGGATAAEGDGAVWTMAAQDAGFEGTTAVSLGFSRTTGAWGALKEGVEAVAVESLRSSIGLFSVATGAEGSVLFGERLLDF